MKLIKRYKNRRLYDTEAKRYITHAELIAIIDSDISFKVVDSVTGYDITPAVLAQVIAGEVNRWRDLSRAKNVLINAISSGGKKSMSILKNTYLASLGIYDLTKKKAEEVIDSLIKAGEISKSQRKDAVMELLEKAEKQTTVFAEKVKKETGNIQKEVGKVVDKLKLASKKDIDAINKKLDKLSQAIDKMGK
jgi:polyhydroxyalkanoate synthesis repressor PhaR